MPISPRPSRRGQPRAPFVSEPGGRPRQGFVRRATITFAIGAPWPTPGERLLEVGGRLRPTASDLSADPELEPHPSRPLAAMAISETDAIPLAIEIILPGGTYR
jgi:hypothetical protein